MKKYFIKLFILFLLLNDVIFSQNSIPIQFKQSPSRNTEIGAFVKNNVLYASLNDIAYVLDFKFYINQETKKFEFKTNEFTIKVTADNPYVTIVDKIENANLIQLPVNVIYAANSFFVPLDAFIKILNNVSSEEITLADNIIVVGKETPKSVYDITDLGFEEKSNGLLIRIYSTKKLTDYECWPKQIGNDTWLYITLSNVRADVNKIKNFTPKGLVKQVLVFQYPTSVQLTIRLKGQINSAEPMIAENGTDILIAVQIPSEEQAAERKARSYERELQREREKWKLDVIVIDAGHGGDDPGAIGLRGTKEKDITLGIALKLGKLIEKKLPDVDVVYTRKTDNFVELYKRGQIANQNGGKLFISIHCNSMPRRNHSENGFEIYLLRPGKTENALRIAEKENEVIKLERDYENRYQKLTEENFILLTMAQSAYVKYSERFADILQQEMGKHLNLNNNGVKQAGFYVLVGASMPNVLIETGYLSNKNDEKFLSSTAGQEKIAEAIFNGVKRFKQEYEKSLSEGKELGSR
jgi:N-acetylmuramoyl-L-alanine amidase